MKVSQWLGSIFVLANLALVVYFAIDLNAIEIPNVISYASLAITLAASLAYYFLAGSDSSGVAQFGIVLLLSLNALGHNANFLVSRAYQGQYVVTHARSTSNFRQAWRVQLDGGKEIKLLVDDPSSEDDVTLDLRKGLFGVYFGNWRQAR